MACVSNRRIRNLRCLEACLDVCLNILGEIGTQLPEINNRAVLRLFRRTVQALRKIVTENTVTELIVFPGVPGDLTAIE